MKQYLSLSNLSEGITKIIPNFNPFKKRREVKKDQCFVVLNSDHDCGLYIRRFIKEINKYPELTEQPKVLRKRSLKNINTGDVIVFGDQLGNIDYDYRVETVLKSLDHLDGRRFKVYDLITDFDKVLKKLQKYVVENSGKEYFLIEDDKPSRKNRVTEVNLDINLYKTRPRNIVPLAILQNEISEEKVTIFDNWVKVGYNQYDIFVDLLGRERVYIDGNKFYVKEDRWGRKYLTK